MRRLALLSTMALILGLASSAQASVIIDIDEVNNNVVVVASGSLKLTGLTLSTTLFVQTSGLNPSRGGVGVGQTDYLPVDTYEVFFSGPTNYGSTLGAFASSGSGDQFGLSRRISTIGVPIDYVSGSALSATNLYNDQTLASLGLTRGATYIFSYAATATDPPLDNFTIRVGQGFAVPVPEPATLAMAGIGLACVGILAQRRRRSG